METSVLSPAASTSTVTPSMLPKQRSHPLRAGSMKETTVINHVDKAILAINRRHAKKFSSVFEQPQEQGRNGASTTSTGRSGKEDEGEQRGEQGYESFKEVVKDVEAMVDVLWVSGTRMFSTPLFSSLVSSTR